MVTTRRGAQTAPIPSQMATPSPPPSRTLPSRNPPVLPTYLERICLGLFPVILVFGTIYSSVSPHTRDAPYDPVAQAHVQDPAMSPSYFAQKSNIVNVLFVKRGWGWVSAAFALFLVTHPSTASVDRRVKGGIRWVAVTVCWLLVTQWCFGAPIIDRGFRWTGGKCESAAIELEMANGDLGDMVTGYACKAAGGSWKGGHDISGHVFLLVLGTGFLMQELGWAMLRWSGWAQDERTVVMSDGAIKGAAVEMDHMAEKDKVWTGLGVGGKAVLAVVGLNLWMLLMTSIYFHTWFEKLTGLLTAVVSLYAVYVVPRIVPALRGIVGLPGI